MHLMLFDLEFKGHHANYIRYIVNYWNETHRKDKLTIIVSPSFLAKHQETVALSHKSGNPSLIRFQAITKDEEESFQGTNRIFRLLKRFKEWYLLCKYAKAINASQCLIMFVDKLQLPIILKFWSPCSISGIYFQPSFHYENLFEHENKTPHPSASTLAKTFRDLLFLFSVNYSPRFNKLFTLDPYAVDCIERKFPDIDCVYLPDPIELRDSDLTLPKSLSIVQEGRLAFLIFGHLDERKGIGKFLDALEVLPRELCHKICLIIVGQLDASLEETLPVRLNRVHSCKGVQVISEFGFVSDQQIQDYFSLAHIVLALYQKHLGMSGILLHAATLKKPVLCQDYGLMGSLVHKYKLGLTVDSTKTEKIAESIQYLLDSPLEKIADPQGMVEFTKSNSTDIFARIIIESLDSFNQVEIH